MPHVHLSGTPFQDVLDSVLELGRPAQRLAARVSGREGEHDNT
jgi:hypothetical protein